SLKYEEMFVVYRRVAQLLTDAGLTIVDPHVGEYCTSFDMAGTSLTLFWLDSELEDLWETPVDASGYRRGSVAPAQRADVDTLPDAAEVPMARGDEQSVLAAATVRAALQRLVATVDENVDELGRIDAIAGDGD